MATRAAKTTAGRARASRAPTQAAPAAPAKKAPAKKAAAPARRTCAAPGCSAKFTAERSTAKYHSKACRERARRSRTQPAAPAASAAKKAPVKKAAAKKAAPPRRPAKKTVAVAENLGLVASVREELEKANAVDSFAGQLALQLARRLVTPDETGISSLSKELRTVMAAALQGVTPPAAADAPAEDEVEKARRKREEARQAAGLT